MTMYAKKAVASAAEHYESFLAEHYSWMLGDFKTRVAEQRAQLEAFGVKRHMTTSRRPAALDLGAGSGLQTLALAGLGYEVTAIDLSHKLIEELRVRAGKLPVTSLVADLAQITSLSTVAEQVSRGGYELAVCMGDTLTHLPNPAAVIRLAANVYELLAPGGRLVLTFRDLTQELAGIDRFIPVRAEADRVMSCFLEYERDTVVVHDLIYLRQSAGWAFHKSGYLKLRLAPAWVADQLRVVGFSIVHDAPTERFWGLMAELP